MQQLIERLAGAMALGDELAGELPPPVGRAVTAHWFDPCELLGPDARSELREEFRERQPGGGWQLATSACGTKRTPS